MIPAKGPAYSPVRFSRKVRRKSLTFCAEIGTFHLEQSRGERPGQTWRATAIHVWFHVRIHETTHRPAGFWLGRKTQKFSGTNQKPEKRRPFGTGLVRGRPFKSWVGGGWVISGHQEFFSIPISWAGNFFSFFFPISFLLHFCCMQFFLPTSACRNFFFSKSPTAPVKS